MWSNQIYIPASCHLVVLSTDLFIDLIDMIDRYVAREDHLAIASALGPWPLPGEQGLILIRADIRL
jgi:hypothetical protein